MHDPFAVIKPGHAERFEHHVADLQDPLGDHYGKNRVFIIQINARHGDDPVDPVFQSIVVKMHMLRRS